MSNDFSVRANAISRWLWMQSAAIAITVFIAAALVAPERPDILLLALPILLFCAILALDAWLLAQIARAPDEDSGCRDVDDFLTRNRLKPRPERTRTLDERIAGTKNLIYVQLVGAALFAWVFLSRLS